MIKLSGNEASILALYAEYIDYYIDNKDEALEKQLGVEAQMIFKRMKEIKKGKQTSEDNFTKCARLILDWANKKPE